MSTRAGKAVVAVVAVVTVVALVVGGCGVPSDSEPRGVGSDDIPGDLLAVPSSTTGPVTPATTPLFPTTRAVGTRRVAVFLVEPQEDRVVSVDRGAPNAPDESVEAAAQTVINVLLQSPFSLEVATGLTTTLSSTTIRVLDVDAQGTLDIEVAQFPRNLADQPLAMAQIVLTLTLVDGVRRVRVFRDGEPFRVPLWLGQSEPGEPVDRSDYIGAVTTLTPPDAPTTTTAPRPPPAPPVAPPTAPPAAETATSAPPEPPPPPEPAPPTEETAS